MSTKTELPPLPEPKLYPSGTYPDGVLTYGADQMQAYATAAVLGCQERADRLEAALRRILDLTDLDMADGDGARRIAAQALGVEG